MGRGHVEASIQEGYGSEARLQMAFTREEVEECAVQVENNNAAEGCAGSGRTHSLLALGA